jgi:alkanesulfonate monooxygenase SsuD/methylene tetrahydromethanopterin reductase-like flavin-dependent oxidoreductase (luciferase family)
VRFGILSFAAAPYAELVRHWRTAEALGFDSAWLADDLLQPGSADFEAWTLLAALARETRRLRLGTLVSSVVHRHPALLAAQAITLDYVSGGRAVVGIGAGGPPNNYALLGLEPWSARERLDRCAEQLAVLDPLLRGEPVAFAGQYYRVAAAEVPVPVQRPRPSLVVAAHGDRGLRLSAQYADGWNSFGGQPRSQAGGGPGEQVSLPEAVDATRRLSERLDGFCREAGRDPASLRRTVLAYRPVPDPLASLDAFDEYVGAYRGIGIEEFTFYWPPVASVFGKRPVSAAQQAAFERIATDRIPADRDDS